MPFASYVPVVVGEKVIQFDVDAHLIVAATTLVDAYLRNGGTACSFTYLQTIFRRFRPSKTLNLERRKRKAFFYLDLL